MSPKLFGMGWRRAQYINRTWFEFNWFVIPLLNREYDFCWPIFYWSWFAYLERPRGLFDFCSSFPCWSFFWPRRVFLLMFDSFNQKLIVIFFLSTLVIYGLWCSCHRQWSKGCFHCSEIQIIELDSSWLDELVFFFKHGMAMTSFFWISGMIWFCYLPGSSDFFHPVSCHSFLYY